MDTQDLNKNNRDELDSTIESKFMNNLQWSMLFFLFNKICLEHDENSENSENSNLAKEFFKGWKKFAAQSIIKKRP